MRIFGQRWLAEQQYTSPQTRSLCRPPKYHQSHRRSLGSLVSLSHHITPITHHPSHIPSSITHSPIHSLTPTPRAPCALYTVRKSSAGRASTSHLVTHTVARARHNKPTTVPRLNHLLSSMSSQSSPLSPNTLPLFITTTMQTAIQHDNLSCSTTTTVASSSAPSRSINSLSLRRTDRGSSPVPPTRFATSPAQSASVATSVVTAVGSFHPVHGDDDSHDRAGSMRSVAVPQMTALQTPPASPEDDSSEFSSSASSSSPVTPVVRIDLSTLPLLRRQRRGTTTSTTSARRKRAAKAAAQMQHPPPAPPSTKISTPPLSPKLVPTTTQQRKQKAPVLGIVAMTDVQATWVTRGGVSYHLLSQLACAAI